MCHAEVLALLVPGWSSLVFLVFVVFVFSAIFSGKFKCHDDMKKAQSDVVIGASLPWPKNERSVWRRSTTYEELGSPLWATRKFSAFWCQGVHHWYSWPSGVSGPKSVRSSVVAILSKKWLPKKAGSRELLGATEPYRSTAASVARASFIHMKI